MSLSYTAVHVRLSIPVASLALSTVVHLGWTTVTRVAVNVAVRKEGRS